MRGTFLCRNFAVFTVLYRARETNGHLTFKIEVFFNKFKKALELTDNTFGIFFHNQLFLIKLTVSKWKMKLYKIKNFEK